MKKTFMMNTVFDWESHQIFRFGDKPVRAAQDESIANSHESYYIGVTFPSTPSIRSSWIMHKTRKPSAKTGSSFFSNTCSGLPFLAARIFINFGFSKDVLSISAKIEKLKKSRIRKQNVNPDSDRCVIWPWSDHPQRFNVFTLKTWSYLFLQQFLLRKPTSRTLKLFFAHTITC